MSEHQHAHHVHHGEGDAGEHLATDPVCGMSVDPHTAEHRSQHQGKTWYFCSNGCLSKFEENPERYLGDEQKPDEPVAPGTIYTCPMHPEIRQEGPGDCPICGMALEPEQVSLDDGPSEELRDMTRRFWIGLVLTLPVLVLEMGGHLTGLDHMVAPQTSNWIQLVLATPVVLWCGWPFFVRGWKSVVSRNLNMFTLIAIGTGVALIYSLVATLVPQVFPNAFRQEDGSVAVYFEAAAVIVVLVLLGQVLELRAREKTSGAIKALLDLAPATARKLDDNGGETDVSLDQVKVGDRLRVRPGDKVPLDGEVLEGGSNIDESMVTGEPMAVSKKPGDQVIGGSINQQGSFIMRADKVGR
ncbi:MAG: YHS domain-containing protein, partial [Marinobacter sp.]|nr:YHS domain-containing protein [Marinobacter sp.]